MGDWKQDYVALFAVNSADESGVHYENAEKLKLENIPDTLYNFRRFDADGRSLDNLRKNQVWLAPPQSFNDPYDCYQTVDIKAMMHASLLKHSCHDDGLEKQRAYLKKRLSEFGEQEKVLRPMLLRLKVCCFSAARIEEAFLMWSHYAQYHTGFCVAYDPLEIGPEFLQPVLYDEVLFDATPYHLATIQGRYIWHSEFLGSVYKHPDWAYEEEWRIVVLMTGGEFPTRPIISSALYARAKMRAPKREAFIAPVVPTPGDLSGLLFPMPMPTALYAGAKIKDDHLGALREWATQRSVPLFKMEMATNRYFLNAVRLS